ncbi:armadillo repeat-containing X-linked protein 2 [Camelus dromedarius]|uniref:armadillo repeat-containing X-linked protein 2 n=1 Tax=Camelus dromedarius TaxID=9838 RepID=UPI00311930A4
MDERRPPGRGARRLENPWNPFSFRSKALPVRGDWRELKGPEIGPALLSGGGGASAPGAAGQRNAAQRAPFPVAAAAAAQPIAQTRRVLPAAWVAAAETREAGSDAPGVHWGLKYNARPLRQDPRSGHQGSAPKSGAAPEGGRGKGRGWRPLPLLAPALAAAAVAK